MPTWVVGIPFVKMPLQTVKEMPSNHTKKKKIQVSLYENKNASLLRETKKENK
jgi:hypothetical protein